MSVRSPRLVRLALVGLLLSGIFAIPGMAQNPRKSSDVVKAEVKAGKISADGVQEVTITLKIDKGWHIYANPVGFEDLVSNQTTVSVTGATKPREVKIEYPQGKAVIDKALMAEYRTYEDQAVIKARVQRAAGDSGALEVNIKLQSCDDRRCLAPSTIKVAVP